MSVIYLTIIVSLAIAIVFFLLFIKTVKSGQYDDLDSPAIRMLFEDEIVKPITKNKVKTKTKQK